jgi:hypothetical protein
MRDVRGRHETKEPTMTTATDLKEMSVKLSAEEARQIAAEILAAKGCELVTYNGRSNFVHVRRADGKIVLCFTHRGISLWNLKRELGDESLYNSKVVG